MARLRSDPRPWWLAEPTRFAGWPRDRARWVVGLAALLLLVSLTAIVAAGPPPVNPDPAKRANDQTDVILYQTIIDGVRHGGDYYQVAADAQRSGHYPLRPFVTMRMPTLAVVEALMPNAMSVALLWTLWGGTLIAWAIRLRPVFPRLAPWAIAVALAAGGMAALGQSVLVVFHEVWSGLLIALSLALWRPNRWVEAVAIALCAMLIRETAALYAIVMLGLAVLQGRRREALGWAAALGVLAIAVAFHAHAVLDVTRASDPHSQGWKAMLGFGFFVKTMTICTALEILPVALGAPFIALSLFGWTAWRDETALRGILVLLAYAALLSLFGRADTFYWGLTIAPLMLLGLAFAPDGLRDLIRAAFPAKRRITVTKVTQ